MRGDDGRSGSLFSDVDLEARVPRGIRCGSTTDPDARLFRNGAGKEVKLAYMGHLLPAILP